MSFCGIAGFEWDGAARVASVGILDKINKIYRISERRGGNELRVSGGVFVAAVYDRRGWAFGAHRRNATIVGGEFLARRRGNEGQMFCRCVLRAGRCKSRMS